VDGLDVIIADVEARRALRDRLERVIGWEPSAGGKSALLASLLETVDDPRFPGAIVPRVRAGRLSFYAVADSGPAWRRLQPLLLAFAGVTLSDFDGRTTDMAPDDDLESILLSGGISHAARLAPAEQDDLPRALVMSLNQLKRAVDAAPTLTDETPRTTGQLLGEFRLALAGRDREGAEACLDSLRGEMRLDAMNLYFLQVQLDAALEEWEELRHRDFFENLCLARRPPRVTAALAEAVYHAAIEEVDATGDATPVLDRFQREVAGRYGNLFNSCPPAPSPAVGKMFMLATLASGTDDRRMVDKLRREADHWPDGERAALQRLADLWRPPSLEAEAVVPPAPSLDALTQIAAVRERPDPTTTDARATLLAASILQSLDGYQVAVDVVGRLSETERRELLESAGVRRMWGEVIAHASADRVPTGWEEFVRLSPDLPFAVVRTWAEKAVAEFPISRELTDQRSIESLVRAIQTAFGKAEETAHQLLPYLLEWARADDRWPNPEYRSLYQELLELLLLGSSRTPTVVKAVTEALAALLEVGLEPESYTRTMRDLADWLPTASGLHTADALIDVVDLLATYPSPQPEGRQLVWSTLAAELVRLWPRLSLGQQSLARDLAATLDSPQSPVLVIPDQTLPAAVPAIRPRAGYLIAIYTLSEGAGQRVQRALAATYPGVRVELSTDHVASPRLAELAARADLFVICWASAKHAATDAIRQRRSVERATLYPRGVGSSSVVREVQEYLTSALAANVAGTRH
jgi:hypothetical protein